MEGTIIQQGSYTSNGRGNDAEVILLRSDVDWMKVRNLTQAAGQKNGYGFDFFWQKNMPNGRGMVWFHPAANRTVAINEIDPGLGFVYVNAHAEGYIGAPVRCPNLITDITAGGPSPIITTAGHGLVTGNVVRLTNCVGAQQITGIDFHVTYVGVDTFNLTYLPAIIATGAPGANAYAYKIFYKSPTILANSPRPRYITAISQEANAKITTSVPHYYEVGSVVRFDVPAVTAVAYGMTEMNGLTGTITSVYPGTIADPLTVGEFRVNIDATGFNAFRFPLTNNLPFTPAMVTPLGTTNTDSSDALVDLEYIAMYLPKDNITSPGGYDPDDKIYWIAGKSWNV